MVCIKCKGIINKDVAVVYCDSCNRVVHRECSDLNASELKVMDLKGKRMLRFFCDDCQAGVKLIPTLIAKVDALEQELNLLKRKIEEPSTLPEETIVNELQERQKRATNIMIYNMPENTSDFEEVKKITREATNNVVIEVVSVTRVGKANKNGARPLKVVYRTSNDAMMVIRKRKSVGRARKIFIDVDMTALQRKNIKKLQEELQDRKAKGENVVIKYSNGTPAILSLN